VLPALLANATVVTSYCASVLWICFMVQLERQTPLFLLIVKSLRMAEVQEGTKICGI